MEWHQTAPWVMVAITAIGGFANLRVGQYRIGQVEQKLREHPDPSRVEALERWKEDAVDPFIAEIRGAKGDSFAQHREHTRRLDRLEERLDALRK